MNHGILLGCMQTPPDLFHLDPDWLNIKRAAGAHKIASFMRGQGWDIEVLDYWLAFDFEEFKEFISVAWYASGTTLETDKGTIYIRIPKVNMLLEIESEVVDP